MLKESFEEEIVNFWSKCLIAIGFDDKIYGSACLFKTETDSYIITASHVFYQILKDNINKKALQIFDNCHKECLHKHAALFDFNADRIEKSMQGNLYFKNDLPVDGIDIAIYRISHYEKTLLINNNNKFASKFDLARGSTYKKACLVGVRSTDLRDNFYIEVIHLENIKSKGMCSTAIRTKDSLYRINGMSGGPIWVITNRKKPKIFLFGVQSYYIEESPRKVGFTRVKKFLDIL